jgi:hypothetical protein
MPNKRDPREDPDDYDRPNPGDPGPEMPDPAKLPRGGDPNCDPRFPPAPPGKRERPPPGI